MKHYSLIGRKLGHSWSPQIHDAFFRLTGISGTYTLTELEPDKLQGGVQKLLSESDGFNVTIPYKADILPFLDDLEPVAEWLGAVNTVLTGRRSMGCNTDLPGFIAMLRHAGIDPGGKRCFILGTGGVSKAAEAGLRILGASEICFVSRSPSAGQLGYHQLPDLFSGLIINATPAGMHGFPDSCPLTPETLSAILPKAEAVVDIVANPLHTPLLCAAENAGIPCCGGLYMLVAQAMESQRLWQGWEEIPAGLTDSVAAELMKLLFPDEDV